MNTSFLILVTILTKIINPQTLQRLHKRRLLKNVLTVDSDLKLLVTLKELFQLKSRLENIQLFVCCNIADAIRLVEEYEFSQLHINYEVKAQKTNTLNPIKQLTIISVFLINISSAIYIHVDARIINKLFNV